MEIFLEAIKTALNFFNVIGALAGALAHRLALQSFPVRRTGSAPGLVLGAAHRLRTGFYSAHRSASAPVRGAPILWAVLWICDKGFDADLGNVKI